MNADPGNEHFARLIVSLEPWLDQVVIIGGWAHRLYRLDPRAQQLSYAPIMTLDTDIAVPSVLQVKDQDIRERLVANGFREEFLGADKPPATHYRFGEEKTGYYAEFLTPLTGSEHTRSRKRKATRRIAGVVSQRLRYIEIMLNAPWEVSLDESTGFPLPQATQVRIANPVSFMAHKLLIHSKRPRAKFASSHIPSLFDRERKIVALFWLKQTQEHVARLMDFHVRMARQRPDLKPSVEVRLTFEYLQFQLLCTLLAGMIRMVGPIRVRSVAGYAASAATHLGKVSEKVLADLNDAVPVNAEVS